MKAAVVNAPNSSVAVEDRARPSPEVGQVLIRVHACGICHSDVNLERGDFPFVRYPVVPGHEVAGTVEEVGQAVEWPRIGDRVGVPWLHWACGHCQQCTNGDEVMCESTEVTGVSQNGGWQEFMLAPAPYVAPLPDSLDFVEAAPLMCAGLTVHNGLRNGGFEPGDRVAVIGLGGLGHLAVQYAHAMGGRVAVLSTSEDKQRQASDLGAELFINTRTQDPAEALASWDGGADMILSTAPSMETANACLGGLAPDGTLVVLGVSNEQVGADPMQLIGGRRRVMGSPSGSRNDLRQALEFAATHRTLPQTTSFLLDDVDQALEQLEAGKITGRAVLTLS